MLGIRPESLAKERDFYLPADKSSACILGKSTDDILVKAQGPRSWLSSKMAQIKNRGSSKKFEQH